MKTTDRIAVFDLDGTVYAGSSLKDYFIFGMRKMLSRGKIGKAIRIAMYAVAAKGSARSHIHSKYEVCRMLREHLTEADMQEFIMMLQRGVRHEVMELMADCRRRGVTTLLSTASPEEYCVPLAHILGFDMCHATPLTGDIDSYVENRGQAKVDRLARLGAVIDTVVTDHYHDLPLLQTAGSDNVLVAPSARTLAIAKANRVNFRILQ